MFLVPFAALAVSVPAFISRGNIAGLLNVPTFHQHLVRGGILLLAVLCGHWKQGRWPGARR